MEKVATKTKPILLIDESFDFDKIKKYLNNTSEIISFDVFSHEHLEKQNIKHSLSDSFLSENDYKEIQEKSYELQQWYDSEELKSSLLFENINLGQLTYVDTIYFITKSLKKFFEILKIYEKYPEKYFITTELLSKILECFTKSFQNIDGKTKSIQYHEYVHYDYKFGKLNLGLNISFKKYKKLKKISEKFFSLFFNPKNISDGKKSVLLVEFDPIKFSDLLLESKFSSVNFILYNTRRPSVWDKNSFNILKKSGTKIISQNLLADKKIFDECEKKSKYYVQIISRKLNEQFFLKTFQFREINLWPVFKNTLIQIVLDNVKPGIFEFLLAQKLFNTYKIDSIIINSENRFIENILMNTAKTKKIPILLMQHGMIYDSKNFVLRNNLTGIYPNKSDYAIVWGELMKKHLISLGYEQKKIKVLGCPIYDNINSKVVKETNTILIATSPPMSDFAIDLSVNTNLNYEKTIKEICIFCKNNNLNLIFKLHPSLEDNIQKIIKENFEDAEIISSGSIIPLIKKCSMMISFDLSTTILEAQLLSTPVISMYFRDNRNLNLKIFENSCPRVSIENFKDMITKILYDDTFRYELIEKGKNFPKSYLSNQNNSCLSLLNFLEKI